MSAFYLRCGAVIALMAGHAHGQGISIETDPMPEDPPPANWSNLCYEEDYYECAEIMTHNINLFSVELVSECGSGCSPDGNNYVCDNRNKREYDATDAKIRYVLARPSIEFPFPPWSNPASGRTSYQDHGDTKVTCAEIRECLTYCIVKEGESEPLTQDKYACATDPFKEPQRFAVQEKIAVGEVCTGDDKAGPPPAPEPIGPRR